MSTITITITVPDGVAVDVQTANGRAPSKPTGQCPVHEIDWRYVKAGVSKRTGKPYSGFWACPERDCDEKPARESAVDELGF